MRILSIGKIAEYHGVSKSTIYRWLKSGKIKENHRTYGNHRRFIVENNQDKIVLYSRVSSTSQKTDLKIQSEKLVCYSKNHYPDKPYQLIEDLGSGINFKKRGFLKLINMILNHELDTLIINHQDRLLRFGFELVKILCDKQNIKIVIIETNKETSFEYELSKNIIEIMTVFCAKLYGSRANKNKTYLQVNKG